MLRTSDFLRHEIVAGHQEQPRTYLYQRSRSPNSELGMHNNTDAWSMDSEPVTFL